MHHGFVRYQGGVLLLILVSAVGGSHLPRPFSFIERGVLRPARGLNALSFRETQGAPDRRNENCPLCRNTDAGHRIGVRLGRIMCNLSKRGAEASPLPKGLAFEIVDLLRVRNWADLHDCRMFIRLDHGVDGGQYEGDRPLHGDEFPTPPNHVARCGRRVPPASHRPKAAVWLSRQGTRKPGRGRGSNRGMRRLWLVVLCAAKRRSSVMEPCCDRKLRLTCSQYRTCRPWL